MEEIFENCYQLPGLLRRYDQDSKLVHVTNQPYDELFLWSLLLYTGEENDLKLSYHFWSKSKFPIACCLVAIIVYNRLINENFVSDSLKDRMKSVIM